MYCRCPSATNVSNASELLPEPLGPVMTTSLSRGMSRLMFLRLWTRTPRRRMASSLVSRSSAAAPVGGPGFGGATALDCGIMELKRTSLVTGGSFDKGAICRG